MNTSPDHPDFTALALGEHIHGTPAQAVLEALRTSVSARHEAEQIRRTAQSLAFVLKGQPPQRLDEARRQAIFKANPAAVRARFAAEDQLSFKEEPAAPAPRAPRTWVYPTAAAAAVTVAAIMVMRLIPGYTAPPRREAPPVAESDPEPTGKIMVTTPATGAPGRERVSVNPPAPAIVNQESKLPPPEKGLDLPAPPAPPPAVVRETPPARPDLNAVPEIRKSTPAPKPGPRRPIMDNFASPPTPGNNH